MAPPGRRRSPSYRSILPFLFLLLLFSTTTSAASAVLGIDLGTGYLKAALVKPGTPLEIVLTKDSKRKEAATLAFKPSRAQATDPEAFPERLFGGDALALAARFPSDVYSNLKSLLGVAGDANIAKEYQSRFPGLDMKPVSRADDIEGKGTVAIKSQSFGKDQEPFMVEELLAMELKNIKANAEAVTGKGWSVTDAVITYPAFYTAEEKRAVELAADLAGLRLLGLISDGLAVGLNYATGRTFESVSDGASPEYHLVYDMGAGSTTATVLKFQGRTIKDVGKRNKTVQEVLVLGTGWDRTLGGDMLNQVIVDDMISQFTQKGRMKDMGVLPIHVKKHAKSMARLWKDAERIRQVLSANSQTSASFEGLFYEDINFKYSLSRTAFEKLVAEESSRVTLPLVQALDSAGVTLEELESIILHGGVVRTPFVQKQLEALAGGSKKIKTNVNADEAAVLGAAFKAAAISPSFRVKDIRAFDTPGFGVELQWTAEGKERQQKLFTTTSQIGAEKQVPFKTLENFKLQFIQTIEEENYPILEVQANNLTASVSQLKEKYGCASANISTNFAMRLSPIDGLPEVVGGTVSCETEASKEGSVIDNVKGLFGFGSKKSSDQAPLEADEDLFEDPASMTPLPVSDPTSSGSTLSSTSSTTPTKPSKSSNPTPTTVTIPLSLTTTVLGLNQPPAPILTRIRDRLTTFDASDRSRMLRSEVLNTLEAFTYRARDYLSDTSFIVASTDKVREQLEAKLDAASEWLYGDGIDAKLQDFKDKLKDLKALVDPVLSRMHETSSRENAIKGLQDQLESMTAMIKLVEGSIERAAEEAASAVTASISSLVDVASDAVIPSAEPKPPSPSTDPDLDDLDDDPYSTSETSSSYLTASSQPAQPHIAPYSAEDVSALQKSYDSIKAWLDEKLAIQEKLQPYDDPAFLVAELELRTQQLQTEVSNVIMKTIRMPGAGYTGGGKKAKKSSSSSNGSSGSSAKKEKEKTKKAKGKSKATKSSRSSTTATVSSSSDIESTPATPTATASSRKKDEL